MKNISLGLLMLLSERIRIESTVRWSARTNLIVRPSRSNYREVPDRPIIRKLRCVALYDIVCRAQFSLIRLN